MRITEILDQTDPSFSFEFFPPKTPKGLTNLFQTISMLETLHAGYVSVTYGAAGSTRQLTLDLVTKIRQETAIDTMAHFTCVGSTRQGLKKYLDQMAQANVHNVLALRGDPPQGETEFKPAEDGLAYASELISFIKENGYDFCIGGACYPETHPDSKGDQDQDLENLKKKVDAGAEFLITQLFFDNEAYFNFRDRARKVGITVPIIPGIMPVTNVAQIERFTNLCGTTLPDSLHDALLERQEDADAVLQLGVAYSTAQCAELLRHGAPGIHFYTLNKSPATRAIVSALRILAPWKNGR